MRLLHLVASFALLGVAAAHAQAPSDSDPADPAGPPPPDGPPGGAVAPMPVAPPMPPPASPNVDKGVLEDANSGRSWLAPTALSAPAGTWSFSDFELFLVSGSYAVTDQLSIGATTLIPIVADQPFWGLLSAKMQVIRQGNVRVALHGAATIVTGSTDGFSAAEVGAAATLCIDSDCHSHATGFIGAGFALTESNSSVPFLVAGSLVARLGKRVKLVLEADTGFIAGDINGRANGFLAWYGVRFTSRNIGVDVGFMKPIDLTSSSNDDIGFPIGLPFVSFTYRSLAGD
ncbi:MAG: hypothetical protein KF773_09760 [Deltaproteobacteria bacterium]|nr:hypothetical protein [Deltaproteobacteria bacterium]MCW5801595.1 hypothetical protein [Deltaproteobacteria bacterium]